MGKGQRRRDGRRIVAEGVIATREVDGLHFVMAVAGPELQAQLDRIESMIETLTKGGGKQ